METRRRATVSWYGILNGGLLLQKTYLHDFCKALRHGEGGPVGLAMPFFSERPESTLRWCQFGVSFGAVWRIMVQRAILSIH